MPGPAQSICVFNSLTGFRLCSGVWGQPKWQHCPCNACSNLDSPPASLSMHAPTTLPLCPNSVSPIQPLHASTILLSCPDNTPHLPRPAPTDVHYPRCFLSSQHSPPPTACLYTHACPKRRFPPCTGFLSTPTSLFLSSSVKSYLAPCMRRQRGSSYLGTREGAGKGESGVSKAAHT